MKSLCRYCAYEQADCKGNKDLEKLNCGYYKKKPVQNVKEMAERIAELEAEVERLRNVQNMHSGDIISRADAIEAFGLSEKTRKYGGDHSGYDTMLKYEIQDVLENLPSAEAKWIPCSERMPEKDELVLVTVWDGVSIAWRNIYGGWESAEDMYEKGDVTAWMPLPKPYREDGEA